MHQRDLIVPLVADDRTAMTPKERAELVLSSARVLHVDPSVTSATDFAVFGRLPCIPPISDSGGQCSFSVLQASARHLSHTS
jgi:hypothetical protein